MPKPSKAAHLSLLEGNSGKKNVATLKKRAEQEEKMKMKTDKLRPPKWLTKEGKEAFLFIVEELNEIELLGNADIYTIALFADFYSQYVKYKSIVKSTGNWIRGKPNPYISKMDNAAKQIRAFGSDLGLSPQSRVRLAIKLAEQEGDEDGWS
ncbi:phage terminase small subunit P27 family [Listeria seeligeri]|uniref:phage terminase small subunit P27 family n=1 Tax=Listeria seeligeri TaxID=1640 RepID=UPI0022EB69DF|nr:phage terminase small subunit P27 family [Listeria seeligeri]